MTYDTQGRRVLHGHPSTCQQEVELLRVENRELALQTLSSEGQAATAYAEVMALRARVQELEAFATECASYTCTCHEAYVGRQMVDPDCMAGEIGYLAQEVLGQQITCRGILASRERWALQKQEGE